MEGFGGLFVFFVNFHCTVLSFLFHPLSNCRGTIKLKRKCNTNVPQRDLYCFLKQFWRDILKRPCSFIKVKYSFMALSSYYLHHEICSGYYNSLTSFKKRIGPIHRSPGIHWLLAWMSMSLSLEALSWEISELPYAVGWTLYNDTGVSSSKALLRFLYSCGTSHSHITPFPKTKYS